MCHVSETAEPAHDPVTPGGEAVIPQWVWDYAEHAGQNTGLCLSRHRIRVNLDPVPLFANSFSALTPGLTYCLGM